MVSLGETAPIVDTSAANTITALSAGVAIAVHIAGGSRSTHTSSTSSNIIDSLHTSQCWIEPGWHVQ